jgi:hypothetical protein
MIYFVLDEHYFSFQDKLLVGFKKEQNVGLCPPSTLCSFFSLCERYSALPTLARRGGGVEPLLTIFQSVFLTFPRRVSKVVVLYVSDERACFMTPVLEFLNNVLGLGTE